ncbi:helix-turn-helix domain-containing protein [Streptomyces sp. NPDC057950]|uniref:helix-turn-helix domain-containing protein n=1 Tax=Streptomyces sp. NPDC057950 TaxID=3346288 RepID=UPI0036E9D357
MPYSDRCRAPPAQEDGLWPQASAPGQAARHSRLARGRGNARIAAETRLHVDTVRTWRGRFADGRLPAPADRNRTGRPARFTPVQVAEAEAPACQLPAEVGTRLSCWLPGRSVVPRVPSVPCRIPKP